MRLWSLHPKYLDPQGLVAWWRETLLAQAVLRNETRGYRHHPQLQRFKEQSSPLSAMSLYLGEIYREAEKRGYSFDRSKIRATRKQLSLTVTSGQLEFEWIHLMSKLQKRNPPVYEQWKANAQLETHPLFTVIDGGIESWERP